MSAPLRLTVDQLDRLRHFLAALNKATKEEQIFVDAYGPATVELDGNHIQIKWDKDTEQYVIDDRIGS